MKKTFAVFVLFVCLISSVRISFAADKTYHDGQLLYLNTSTPDDATVALYLDDQKSVIVLYPGCTTEQCVREFAFLDTSACLDGSPYCAWTTYAAYKTKPAPCDKEDRDSKCLNVEIYINGRKTFTRLIYAASSVEEFAQQHWPGMFDWRNGPPRTAASWVDAKEFFQANQNAAVLREQEDLKKLSDCLRSLKIGDASSKAYSCGTPSQTNASLRGDQLIYPEGTIVYIDKTQNTVTDVQWTHPN